MCQIKMKYFFMIQFMPNLWLLIFFINMMFFMISYINMYFNKKMNIK